MRLRNTPRITEWTCLPPSRSLRSSTRQHVTKRTKRRWRPWHPRMLRNTLTRGKRRSAMSRGRRRTKSRKSSMRRNSRRWRSWVSKNSRNWMSKSKRMSKSRSRWFRKKRNKRKNNTSKKKWKWKIKRKILKKRVVRKKFISKMIPPRKLRNSWLKEQYSTRLSKRLTTLTVRTSLAASSMNPTQFSKPIVGWVPKTRTKKTIKRPCCKLVLTKVPKT